MYGLGIMTVVMYDDQVLTGYHMYTKNVVNSIFLVTCRPSYPMEQADDKNGWVLLLYRVYEQKMSN